MERKEGSFLQRWVREREGEEKEKETEGFTPDEVIEGILSSNIDQIQELFHETLDKILSLPITPTQSPKYTRALTHILSSESLKYTLLFLTQKLQSLSNSNTIYLTTYVPKYLQLANVEIVRDIVMSAYRRSVEIIEKRAGGEEEGSEFLKGLVKEFLEGTLEGLGKSSRKGAIKIETLLEILECVFGIEVGGSELYTEKVNQKGRQLLAESDTTLQQLIKIKSQKLSLLYISDPSHPCILTPLTQLYNLSLFFLTFPSPSHIPSILTLLSSLPSPPLSLHHIPISSLLQQILHFIGTTPSLKQQSPALLSQILQLPYTPSDKRRIYFDIILFVSDNSFKSFCLMQYNGCSKGVVGEGEQGKKELVEVEMMVDQLERVDEGNVEYVRGLVSCLYRISWREDVQGIVEKIRKMERVGLKEHEEDLLEYSLSTVQPKTT